MPHAAAKPREISVPWTHPLEVFPVFRRVPRSRPRNLLYTAIWNSLFAGLFILLNLMLDPRATLANSWWPIMVLAQCIGFAIDTAFAIGHRVLPDVHRRAVRVRVVYFAVLSLVGTFVGYLLGTSLLDFGHMREWVFSPRGALAIGTLSVVLSLVLVGIFIPRERAARLEAEVEKEEARASAARRDATLAQLKLLEAQVEPHFLYNALANVVSLIDSDPATAKRMVDRLIVLLRSAAASAGSDRTPLATQVDHLHAYLDLMALRMGGRLSFAIDVPDELAARDVPPLLLQPLVENAIRHGLEPKVEGGEIRVTARRDGAMLVLVVADTGVGVSATRRAGAGSGLGLANLRARLQALYGSAASMVVEDNAPAGARITLRLPLTEPA